MSNDFAQREFKKLLGGVECVNLVWLMLEFAADAYPDIDWLSCLAEIDRLGELARARLAALPHADWNVKEGLAEVSRLLYHDEGFRGNREAYYDPRNSYLNDVLSRRMGIPISLGIVFMAVACRAGLETYGVAAPGHFVVGCDGVGETWYVDPFNEGDVLQRFDCQRRIEEAVGKSGLLCDEHFRPASHREIAIRVLRNLKAAYAMANQWPALVPVQKRLVQLLPFAADESRDLGLIYLRMGQARPALDILEKYAANCSAEQSCELAPYLKSARRMMAELN